MDAPDVLAVLEALDGMGIGYWIDGGWGVDSLLGEQTRQHGDLDLVVPRPEVEKVSSWLAARGFEVIRDLLPTAVAVGDEQGREVDLHPVDLTDDGGGDQVLLDGDTWHYAQPVTGTLGGREVRCAPAEDQLAMHQGYEPRPVDHADVRRLAARFGLPLPPPYDGHQV